MRTRSIGLTLVTLLAVVVSACGGGSGGSPAPKALKIGLVTDVGSLNDKSFNEASWAGAQQGATAVGAPAPQNIVTKKPADYGPNIQTFIDQKFDVIVTAGFALGDATLKAAQANPTVKFIGVDQFICIPKDAADKTCAGAAPANYQGLVFAEAQAGYLAGIVAGTLSKSKVVGAVGGINTIPPVVSYIRGYENGAKSIDPSIQVLIQYVDTDITKAFNEPDKGKSIAQQMIGQKADVMFQVAGLSGQGVLTAACDANVYGIGVDVDQAVSVPATAKCTVTSAEKKLLEAVDAAIIRVWKGTSVGGNVVADASADPPLIGISPYHDLASVVTPDTQAKVDAALAAMKAGTLDPCKPVGCDKP
jgi:basic membrane protein A